MSNRERYREHRINGSLSRHIATPSDPAIVDRYSAEAYHQRRGIYFTQQQLEQMPWQSRELIESEASRIHGPRRGGRR